jgi:hypothetical protein
MTNEPSFNDTHEPTTIIPQVGRGFTRGSEVVVNDAIGFAPSDRREDLTNPNREQDRRAWQEDNRRRIARAALKVRRIERPKLTGEQYQTDIDSLLAETEKAVETYNDAEGKPNLPLIEARDRVARLTAELAEAKAILADEDAKGSILDRFRTAITHVENRLLGLVGSFGEYVRKQLIIERLGHVPPAERISPALKAEVRQHVRIARLDAYLPKPIGAAFADRVDRSDADLLFKRANDVANKLDAFKQHVAEEGAH